MTARLKGRRLRAESVCSDLTEWARLQTDVQGLALVGSYAYDKPTMASDVDLVLVTPDKQPHLDGMSWAAVLDRRPRLIRSQQWGPLTEQRIRLSSGLVVELGIVTAEWLAIPLDPGTARVLADGCCVLYDPDHLFRDALNAL
jgi:uncharacterized protein